MSDYKVKNICAVKSCLKTYEHGHISLFRFPKDFERCRQWALACGIIDLFNQMQQTGGSLYTSYYRVCSMHFENEMFVNENKKRLHLDAIPTLYLDEPSTSRESEDRDDQMVGSPAMTISEVTLEANKPVESEEEEVLICVTPTSPEVLSDVASRESSLTPTSTQTEKKLSSKSPRKQVLRRKIKVLEKRVAKLQKKLDGEIKKNQLPLADRATPEDVKEILMKNFPSGLANFLVQQYELLKKIGGGRRYTLEFKYFCLKIYFLGPKCYSFLEKFFVFPSKSTLFRLTHDIKLKPGINDFVFDILKIKVNGMDLRDKLCVLCFDEMAIKSHLFYNITDDEIVGFEDLGKGKKFQPALNALVVMVKGIFNNWKQPLAYFLVHNTCSFIDLKIIITEITHKLRAIGLLVKVCVSDMGASNIKLTNSLGITIEKPYFYVEDMKIIYIFDVPHLIKAIRNLLYSYDITSDNKVVSWKHIEAFYNIDKTLSCRLAPKLTDSHLHPTSFLKMKVSLATQLLSTSVANGLGVLIALGHISTEASETQKFIEMFDNLFDIFNSTNLDSAKVFNRAFKGTVEQITFLKNAASYLKSIQVVNSEGKVLTNKFKSIKCFQISINGLLNLWEILKQESYLFVLTRRLNQDALENFFGAIRRQGGSSVNPTSIQFYRAFKKLFALRFLNSGTENCSEDHAKLLAEFEDFKNKNIFVDDTTSSLPNIEHTSPVALVPIQPNYRYHDVEKNSIRYICGYLIRKCLNIHSCDVCEEYANAHENLDETTLLCHFKAYQTAQMKTFGNLFMPHDNFFYHICEFEEIFKNNFERCATGKNVGNNFIHLFRLSQFIHPCNDFPYQYLLNLYCRMRIFYTLKFANKNFKTVDRTGQKSHRKIIIWRHD